MDYIINPVWFYLIDLFDTLDSICLAGLIFSAFGFLSPLLFLWINDDLDNDEDKDVKRAKKVSRNSLWFVIGFGALALLIPGKDTMIEMMIAKLATKSNAANAVEAIKSAVDYVLKAVAEMKG